jgi:hypothetical protein
MPNNPKKIEEKIQSLLSAWQTLAPTKSFAGLTFAEFNTQVAPSLTARTTISNLESQLTEAINQRDDGDKTSLVVVQRVVNGILADPTEGPDSSLIEAAGRVRKSERKSGLTRKVSTGGATPPTAP